MSAYCTWEARVTDLDGVDLGTFQFRMITKPTHDDVETMGLEYFGCDVKTVSCRQTILLNKNIGRRTPAARQVSARVMVIA